MRFELVFRVAVNRSRHLGKKPVERLGRSRRLVEDRFDALIAVETPGSNSHGWTKISQCQRDLGQRPESAADGDDAMRRQRQDGIAGVSHAGGDRNLNELVRVLDVRCRQEADGQAPDTSRAPGGVFHNARHAAADQDRAALGNSLPHLECQFGKRRLGVRLAADGDEPPQIVRSGMTLACLKFRTLTWAARCDATSR